MGSREVGSIEEEHVQELESLEKVWAGRLGYQGGHNHNLETLGSGWEREKCSRVDGVLEVKMLHSHR